LSKDGGSSHAFFNNYRPQFYFRTTGVTGAINQRPWKRRNVRKAIPAADRCAPKCCAGIVCKRIQNFRGLRRV
jgi:hypothetical protein